MLEVLVSLALLAILAALALPSMREFIVRANVSSTTNDLVVALNLARAEAVKRGRDVAVVAAGAEWNEGWIVQTVSPANVLARYAARDAGYRVLGAASGSGAPTDRVVFGATGGLRQAATYDFSVCRPAADADAAESRRIAIAGSGSIRTHRDASGSPAGSCG